MIINTDIIERMFIERKMSVLYCIQKKSMIQSIVTRCMKHKFQRINELWRAPWQQRIHNKHPGN